MKRRNALGGIVLVMATGMALPGSGCFLFGDEAEEEGRLCASPVQGGTYCVPFSSGPRAACSLEIAGSNGVAGRPWAS